MDSVKLSQIMTDIASMYEFEKIDNGVVMTPSGDYITGNGISYIEVAHLKDDFYLFKPNNFFWCYTSILKRDSRYPRKFIEYANIVHYSEYDEPGFEHEIMRYNKIAGIKTIMGDLLTIDSIKLKTLF